VSEGVSGDHISEVERKCQDPAPQSEVMFLQSPIHSRKQ